MKKRSVAVFTVVLCCLTCCWTGCAADASSNSSQGSSQSTSELPAKLSAPYTAEDLKTLSFTDVEKALTVDVSDNHHLNSLLLSVEYYAYEHSQTEVESAKYILTLQDQELRICPNGVVLFLTSNGTETTEQAAVVLEDEFAYLSTILEGGEVAFDGYTATQTVKVYNAENAGGEITEKESFLENLKALRFVKLQNISHYQTGAAAYTLQIGDDEITVYQKFVVLKGELYSIHQGNFDFLKNLKFGSPSGYLPWIGSEKY